MTVHAVVIPTFGPWPEDLCSWLGSLRQGGFPVVVVDNNPDPSMSPQLRSLVEGDPQLHRLENRNRGGVAGGFNRGIELAIRAGAEWVTLLDQDSRLRVEELSCLREPWGTLPGVPLMVGPMIWDARRHGVHGKRHLSWIGDYLRTRLLISSGTTFRTADWPRLGPMMEWLVVDFVDHAWSFQAQAKGFQLVLHPQVYLVQRFGEVHPHPLCRMLGMELYSPMRHFYSLRNLRWLLLQAEVPIDLRLKELLKMLIKPALWLMFEPRRAENLRAVLEALRSPLPTLKKS